MSQEHSQILSCSRGGPIFLECSVIKSGSGLETKLATHYALYEEMMKTLRHYLKRAFIENVPIQKCKMHV